MLCSTFHFQGHQSLPSSRNFWTQNQGQICQDTAAVKERFNSGTIWIIKRACGALSAGTL